MENEDVGAGESITINGEKYALRDLNAEQMYLVQQLQSCQAKLNNLNFEKDQINMAMNGFKQRLTSSIADSHKKKMG